ncbi:MAG: HEAT repeat domain-containing protein [bacterium]
MKKILILLIILFLPAYQIYGGDEFEKTIELLQKGNDQEREYAAEFLGKLKMKKAIPFLKDAMAKDNSWLVRLSAVSSLNKLGEPYNTEIIEKSLQNTDKYVRLKAAHILQDISEWENKEIILNLFKDKDVEVRKNIIIAAGKLGLKEALEPIILMLKDPISDTRESAAVSLGNLRDRRAVKPLLGMLEDSSPKVVRAAVISLGEIGDEGIMMPMIRMLGHRDRSVRYFAINVLGELGGKNGFKAILGMVKDKEIKVRLGALIVLGRLKVKEYIPIFKEVLTEDIDPYVKLKAARNLALLEDYTGYDLIKNELFNKNTDLKREAIEILGIIKDKSSVSILEDLFLYPNPEIKETVIWSLGEIGESGTFEFLLKKLKEGRGFKIAIIDALKKFQDKRLIPYLNNYLDDENFMIRKHAASALSDFPDSDSEIEQKLINLLLRDTEYLEVRQAALITLIKWDKKIDSELLDIAKNNSNPFQMAAIAGLTELNNKEAIPIIKFLYEDKISGRYRLLLAYQLASFGDYSGKDLIIEMAKSEDYVLRKQAAEYSFKFINSDVFLALSSLINDNKKEVKLAAAKSLGQMSDSQAVDILLNNLVVENLYLETEIENSLICLQDISIDSLINIFKGGSDSVYMERAGSVLVKIGAPVVDKLIKTYEGKDVSLKICMMDILTRIGKDSLIPLISYWDGNFVQSNNILVDTIIKISIEYPKMLVDLLGEATLRNKAVQLISRLTPDKILDSLIDKLYASGGGMERIKVIECLRGMSSAAADRLIADLLKSDDSRKLIIIEALGEMRIEKTIAPLAKMASETQNVKIKEAVNQVIANLKQMLTASGKSKLDKLKKKRGKITMIEKNYIFTDLGWQDNINVGMIFQIFDNNNEVINKLEITEVVGNNASIGKMLNDIEVDIGYVLEEEVKEAGITVSGMDEIKIQLERLKDNNLQIKANAINILGDKGNESVLPEIIYFLEDENISKNSGKMSEEEKRAWINIRKNAAWAIGEIEYKLISKIYKDSGGKKSLTDKEQEMLNKITDILVKLFSDADSGVCLAAVRNVTRLIPLRGAFDLKNDFIFDPLCNLLSDADNYTQRAVIETLAELKDPKAIPFLINAWNDDDATVRGNVAWALEKIGKPAVPSLKDALKGTNDEKKRAAARVLYKLGYKIKRSGNNYEVIE